MLAAMGFGVTGILFIIFALGVRSLGQENKLTFEHYSRAYFLLAASFIFWSISSAVGKRELLAFSVVVGDILILVATTMLLNILLDHSAQKKLWLIGAGTIGGALLLVRTIFFYPKPFMTDGILFFNSQRLVSFTLTAVFLLIWLPVNLRIAQMMTSNLQSQALIYKLLYTTATLSAAIFLLAKTPLAVSLSFTAISVSFLSLVVSNFYAKRMGVDHAR